MGADRGGEVSMLTSCCSQKGSQPCPSRRQCWSSSSTSWLRPKSSCYSSVLLFSTKGQAFVQAHCNSEHSGQSVQPPKAHGENTLSLTTDLAPNGPFIGRSSPGAPRQLLLFTWVLLPSTQLLSSPLSVHCIPGAHTVPRVHVCICVYMYADVCLYLCANICAVYTCVSASLYACIYLCVHLCARIGMCACVYLCVCVYLCAHVCTHVPCALHNLCACVCLCVHVCPERAFACVHMCVHEGGCVSVCACMSTLCAYM